ncbi:MAG: rhomboid family intramembrane serine protease [archaeon]
MRKRLSISRLTKQPSPPVATILLILINILFFYYLSSTLVGTPSDVYPYALKYSRPLTYFTYSFVHLWPVHLFANLLFLSLFGAIIESRMGPYRFLMFYFVGAIVTGLLAQAVDYATLGRLFVIVGASGAIFTLLGAAIAVRPVFSLAAYLILGLVVVPYGVSSTVHAQQELSLAEAQAGQAVAEQNIEIAQGRYESGYISEPQMQEIVAENTEIKEQAEFIIVSVQEAQTREQYVKTAESTHAIGLFVGLILILVMEPGILKDWERRAELIVRFFERLR